MERNARLVLAAKTARTFCYGFLGVLLPVHLAQLGVDARGIGTALTLTLLASAAMTYAVRRPAERWGPRVVLAAQAGCIVAAAVLFLAGRQPWLVVLAAMLGNLAVGTGETGPFLTLEQVVITRTAVRDRLTTVLSVYNLVGYTAAGLGAAAIGWTHAPPQALFAIFLLSGLAQVALYLALTSPPPGRASAGGAPPAAPSRPLVRRLAALFALDSFAGGFVAQSLIAYFLYARFGLDLATLGWVFFGVQILSGLSLLIAARAAPALGLVNTMVFSHLISNGLLIGIALAPTATMAVALLFARHLLSQMDVPTRQTFLMLAVEDHEREGAASLTNTSRTLAQAVSPALTGWIMQGLSLAAPFLLGGGLKIVYDLMLYGAVRHVRTR
ncbi:MAG TPA: MFS transporter [Methylomirabilota bacterium]|nr:MFS transporter [Methylomirabilota bacterium]